MKRSLVWVEMRLTEVEQIMTPPDWTDHVPSGPGRLPGVGHALALARDPLTYVRRLGALGPLTHLQFGSKHVAWVHGPEAIHELLAGAETERIGKGNLFTRMTPAVGVGLASRDEGHRARRDLIQPVFHRDSMVRYGELMSRRAGELADGLVPGRAVAMEVLTTQYSIGTLAACMFPDSSLGRSSVRAVQRILPTILDTMLTRAVMPPVLTPVATMRFHRAARVLRRTIRDVIAQSRRDGESSSLTARLMAARDPETGRALTDVEVLDEDATMLFAGTETTAATLAWALDSLARHPEAEGRMRSEIEKVLAGRPVTYQDVAKLKFTEAVVQEALRQHGVVLLMRRTHAPVTLSGVQIPAGTEVAFSLYAMHRDPAVYRDPETFDPDRWSPEGRTILCPHAQMPFGAGARKCIGDRFSVVENVITLATLYQRGRFATVPGRPEPRERLAGLAGPDGVYLSWHPHAEAVRVAA